ncbi:glucose uptake protein [Enterococcus villorum]|uniref:hypothetical protein n=1 Tax=Enterococcus villorum TaxID=112904 RepID=UPI00046E2C70|nr:hypothetical protein [Enterococcus villorum]
MVTIGQLVFYIPFFIMLSILLYYINWTKRKLSVLFFSLPCTYFTYQIFSFRHWETPATLIRHIIGFVFSMILLIFWLFFLYRNQK